MNTSLSTQDLIQATRDLLTRGKELYVQIAYNLKDLRDSDAWKEYKSFPKFCHEQLELSETNVSKYLAIADYFSAKYLPEDIGATPIESLYLASRLPGSIEENLSRAKTLSRQDLKQEKADVQPHEFVRVCYCSVCGLSEANHP